MIETTKLFNIFQKLIPLEIEIVIYDIKTNKIIFKQGNITQRSIGDPLYLESGNYQNTDGKVYVQTTNEGKTTRSISLPILKQGKIAKIICINCDISIFSNMEQLLYNIINSGIRSKPEILFKNEYKEKIDNWIKSYLIEKSCRLEDLSSKEKKTMVYKLYINQAFKEKKAVEHVANALAMGRSTIFKYLKEWKDK